MKKRKLLEINYSSEEEEKKEEKEARENEKQDVYINKPGFFPSFIYIPIIIPFKFNKYCKLIFDEVIKNEEIQRLKIEPKIVIDKHVSLSRNFAINFHQIDGFLKKLECKVL